MCQNSRGRAAPQKLSAVEKHDPVVRKFRLDLPKPTLEYPTGDVERILEALCSASPELRPEEILVPLELIRRAPDVLREASFCVTAVLARRDDEWQLIDLIPGLPDDDSADAHCFGLAVDVGTTTVSVYLVDMTTGEIAGMRALDNPQATHGEDILSRIHFCQESGGPQTLRELVVGCINDGVDALADDLEIRTSEIYAVSIAGNPTMMHLLLGLDPYYLCREPYVPVFNQPPSMRASDLGLNVHPDAPAYIFPGLGSYFGGDVVAGILASGMHKKSEVSLLVDVGTNAEIVLGNREWLVVCAGAAGPALEAGGIKAGMRAADGAIESAQIDRDSLEPQLSVIGGGEPKGICGSGLIDLVAELFLAEVIDAKGRIRKRRSDRIKNAGDARGYAVALADRGEASSDIVIDELDIGNFLRAKGAMYTALTLITERMGVRFDEIESFYVAGSFGEHINPKSAIAVGMLPDIPLDRFKNLGNSAGIGACLMLISQCLRDDIEEMRAKTTYTQLTTDNEFMNRLSAAIFLPHTDRELFPSVPRQG